MRLIGRRNFIQGFGLGAGTGLLTPFARSVVAEARGLDTQKARWILVHCYNGFGHGEKIPLVERWVPSNRDLTARGALPPSLEPLAPWASKMLILDYLSNPFNPGQHGTGWASLSVRGTRPPVKPPVQQTEIVYPRPTGITVDVLAGETLSAGRPFRSINVATDGGAKSCDASKNSVSYLRNSLQAYQQIFGSFEPMMSAGTPNDIKARLRLKRSMFDSVIKDDLGRMRARLAGREKEKLDQLEGSIRALELQLGTLADGPACTLPGQPTSGYDAGPANGAMPAEFLPAMVDMQLTALICGLTNVVVLSPTPLRRTWKDIPGVNHDQDKHNTSHADDTGALVKIDQYVASLIAKMLGALQKVPEGNGTMADRTLATWIDDGGGRHHVPRMNHDNHPVILVGSMNGHFKTGRHVRWQRGEHAISDAYVSILQSLGIAADTFGDPSVFKGPLPGLT